MGFPNRHIWAACLVTLGTMFVLAGVASAVNTTPPDWASVPVRALICIGAGLVICAFIILWSVVADRPNLVFGDPNPKTATFQGTLGEAVFLRVNVTNRGGEEATAVHAQTWFFDVDGNPLLPDAVMARWTHIPVPLTASETHVVPTFTMPAVRTAKYILDRAVQFRGARASEGLYAYNNQSHFGEIQSQNLGDRVVLCRVDVIRSGNKKVSRTYVLTPGKDGGDPTLALHPKDHWWHRS